MAFSIVTFSDSLKNLIDKNNTTTSSYDVSGSLKTRVVQIKVGYHKDKPIPNTNYPCIWIEPIKADHEWAVTGRNALRDITLEYNITAITNVGLGYDNGREVADREMLQLATNIETLLRNYPQLSVTTQVMSSLVRNVEYGYIETNETYNSMANVGLEIKIRSV